MTEAIFYNAVNILFESDYRKLERLLNQSGKWEEVWKNLPQAPLEAARARSVPLPLTGQAEKGKLDPQNEWQKLEKLGIRLVMQNEPEYPSLLKEIPQPPFGIYVLGNLQPEEKIIFAIVGTRKATSEGRELAKKFAAELAGHGFAIASGLALGIDAAAHEGCLEAKGHTVAVLGNGLDQLYPRTNERLAKKILDSGGAIISEYPPGAPPFPGRFLERNRIVSGLSRGVLVIEAPRESGARVTARHALDQNRDVFVIPGPISHPSYIGSNQLIRQGAELVTKPEEILESFGIETVSEKGAAASFETPEEKLIFETLAKLSLPANVDKIIEMTKLESSGVNRALTMLTIKNLIKETEGGYTIS